MPDDTMPTFDDAITAAARVLRDAEQNQGLPDHTEAATRIADRWLNLATLIKNP